MEMLTRWEDAAVTYDHHGKLIYQALLHLLRRLLAQKKRGPEQDQQNLSLLIYGILGKGNILLEDALHSSSLSSWAGCLEYSLGAAGGPAHNIDTPGNQSVSRF